MTLSSTLNKHIYVGNGVTKTFDYEGVTALIVGGTTLKVSLFDGRLFNQSGDYSINLNQSSSAIPRWLLYY